MRPRPALTCAGLIQCHIYNTCSAVVVCCGGAGGLGVVCACHCHNGCSSCAVVAAAILQYRTGVLCGVLEACCFLYYASQALKSTRCLLCCGSSLCAAGVVLAS